MSKEFKEEKPALAEEEVLKFWQDNKIFEKSLEKKASKGDFIFYDGPPFANGLPHYGHILASVIKDAIPRYKTMKGYRVPRKWGWDCHGLPVEQVVEKELNLGDKKEIEKFGIEKFNKEAKKIVLRDTSDWKKIIPRIGRFVDMEADYRTMDSSYTESVWWVFKSLYEKGLIYEGYKPMHLCPRCETTLANFEVAQGYKDITDISVIAKFELIDEPNTFILAWTTTPWTLPGNVALAINPDVDYVKIKKDDENFILAKERLEIIGKDYEILEEFKGSSLIGKKYKPVFNYYSSKTDLENKENAWKIYSADFVTTGDGTGVVHIAPAFGEDDMSLLKKETLPFVQHVSIDGKFKDEVKDFSGLYVKPKENHQATDIEIIKYLAHNNKLFAKEKISHSYPHCWRCDTPLLNYATSSWFTKVTTIKDKLIANNKKINWTPSHLKDGRFGKWLEGARDWAISRTRFWGAPLPVWKCDKCDTLKVLGSIEELKKNSNNKITKLLLIRHGESDKNVQGIHDSSVDKYHLTNKGKKDVSKLADNLKNSGIDSIYASPVLRTRETSEIIADRLGLKVNLVDELKEVNNGNWEGKRNDQVPESRKKYKSLSNEEQYLAKRGETGESWKDLEERTYNFLKETMKKEAGKTVAIVSHQGSIVYLFKALRDLNLKETIEVFDEKKFQGYSTPFPVYVNNEKGKEFDLHRPHIDEIEVGCSCGSKMKRVPDVFDCWFESGSMPYGQSHYPFENKENFDKNFPAEFIAEGLDQTRGWFYTLLVLSTALFDKPAYKNVIVNGIILAEDGQKMSKRLKNYPDPMDMVNKYGADALRLYLLASPVVRAEDVNFSEKGVDEIYKKVIMRLWNVYSFYEMYPIQGLPLDRTKGNPWASSNVLDKWILARLDQLVNEVSKSIEKYELDKATRPIEEFIDDLSTWYIRRSRDRFKEEGEDKNNTVLTTRFVLLEFSKIIAPFMPFMAERLYKSLDGGLESVHLEKWPEISEGFFAKIFKREDKIINSMKEVRQIVSLGLEARAKANIKVRQPLRGLKVKSGKLKDKDGLLVLIKDELNIKEVIFDLNIENKVELITELNTELIQEGQMREIIRFVQNLRKESGLTPNQKITLEINTDSKGEDLIKKFKDEIEKSIGAKNIQFSETVERNEIKIGDLNLKLEIKT